MEVVLLDGSGAPAEVSLLLSTLGSSQARTIVARLGVEPSRTVTADELADIIWQDELPGTWSTVLRGAVSKARRWIASHGANPLEVLVHRAGVGYSLVLPDGWTVDVQTGRTALARAEAAWRDGRRDEAATAAAHAAAALDGRFMPGLDGVWVSQTRRLLHEQLVRALELAAVTHGAYDDDAAVRFARRLIHLEPFREPAHRLLMVSLDRLGDRAGALAVHGELRDLLSTELGIGPSAETEAVRRQIEQSAIAPATPDAPAHVDEHAGFVGRRSELEQLRSAWSRTQREGRLRVVLLAGEAGIGKSTLADHLADEIRATGATVLIGRCTRRATIPYEPVVEAIGDDLARSQAAGEPRAGIDDRRELAWLIPSLGRTPVRSSDAEHDRHRLFEAIAMHLLAITSTGPTALVVDDVQWASEATLLLLGHLLRRTAEAAVLVVLVERRPEVSAGHLGAMIAELRRSGSTAEIVLDGLDQADTETLLRHHTGLDDREGSPSIEAEAAALRLRSGGNPYFIGEILRSGDAAHSAVDDPARLDDGTPDVPRGVIDIVEHHAREAGDDATLLLRSAAVVGASATVGLIRDISALPTPRFVAALDAAMATGLLRSVSGQPGMLVFSHALARDAVIAGTGQGLVMELHQRAGTAKESLRERGAVISSADLAHHFRIAAPLGHADRAARHAIDAARVDLRVGAREDAARRLAGVLELDVSPASRAALLLHLGALRTQGGDAHAGRTMLQEAAALADHVDDVSVLADVALALNSGGRGVSTWSVDQDILDLLRNAIARIDPEDRVRRVRLLGALADWMIEPETWPERHRLANEAMDISAESTDPAVAGAALAASRVAWWRPDQTEDRLRTADRVLAIARSAGDDELAVAAMLWRIPDLVQLGDRREVDAALAATAEAVATLGLVGHAWELALWDVGLALCDGQFDRADERATAAYALWEPAPPDEALRCIAEQVAFSQISRGRGRYVARMIEASGLAELPAYAPSYALALSQCDRRDDVVHILDDLTGDVDRTISQHANWLFTLTMLAEASVAVAHQRAAAPLRAAMEPHAGRMVVLTGPSLIWGSVDHQLGALAELDGDLGDAQRRLRSALELHRSFGARLWVARTSFALARVLLASGHGADEARSLLDDVVETTAGMGAGALHEDALALLAAAG